MGLAGEFHPLRASPNPNFINWNKLCGCTECKQNLSTHFYVTAIEIIIQVEATGCRSPKRNLVLVGEHHTCYKKTRWQCNTKNTFSTLYRLTEMSHYTNSLNKPHPLPINVVYTTVTSLRKCFRHFRFHTGTLNLNLNSIGTYKCTHQL